MGIGEYKSGIFISIYHLIFLALLPAYFITSGIPSIGLIVLTVLLICLVGLSVTAGYHRYYAHKAYKTKPLVELALLFFGTLSAQGSVLKWSHDHRLHHKHVDGDEDPYAITRGFWFAHVLWLFLPEKEIDMKIVSDLTKKKLVMIQHNHYGKLLILTNLVIVALFTLITGDLLGTIVFSILARIFIVHHATWFINSLAHYWGEQTYSKEHSAVDNYAIALLTWGEGYHNYHHTFASDYRNGIRWYHFDPTKWLIWSLAKFGLASDLKRVNHLQMKKKMVLADKHLLLDSLKDFKDKKTDEWHVKINEISETISQKIDIIKQIKHEVALARKNKVPKMTLKELMLNEKAEMQSLHIEWKRWQYLVQDISAVVPIHVH